jgi:hypothetical protein
VDETRIVGQVVEKGAQEIVEALKAYDEIKLKFGVPMSDGEMSDLIKNRPKYKTNSTGSIAVAWLV